MVRDDARRSWDEDAAVEAASSLSLTPSEIERALAAEEAELRDPTHDVWSGESAQLISDVPSDVLSDAYHDQSLSLEETRDVILSQQLQNGAESLKGFLKPQLSDDPAEIVIITTSLRGGVKSFFGSIRLVHFMNCKRVLWACIDTNKDVITGRSLLNSVLLKKWEKEASVALNANGKVIVPQCVIDGVSVGDVSDVVGLEEDGDLDYIINRDRCPKCFDDRTGDECYTCGTRFQVLIPESMASSGQIVYCLGFDEVPYKTTPEDYPPQGNRNISLPSVPELEDHRSSFDL